MEQSNVYQQNFYTPQSMGGADIALCMHYQRAVPPSLLPMPSKPEQIEELVAHQLEQLKTHYADEEQRYVDQMLLQNPIVVERRAAPKPDTAASVRDVQRQRAESCRKSRYNNKIKKAKLRFRHKFVCNQLTESAGALDCIREVIAQAEAQLLARGFQRKALERMRQNYGLERCGATAAAASAAATTTMTTKNMLG